jgi:FAD synthetase
LEICHLDLEIMIKVMSFGTFDILHPGHLSYLKQARKFGDCLVVVIARDKNVLRLKKRLPSLNEKDRLAGVKKTGLADETVLGSLKNKLAVIEKYQPDVICLGYDQVIDEDKLKELFSGKIIRMKSYKPDVYKSSKIRKK